MSFNKQSDLKKHLSHRTRSEIHLMPAANRPNGAASPGVENVEPPASPEVTQAESPLDHVPKEFEALRDFLTSESSDNHKSVQK